MKARLLGTTSGFTVIEVILFLAITGLMMLGIFIGISGAITRQQYEDTVSSLVDYTQGQYNLVSNVRANRDAAINCTTAGFSNTGGTGRGTSNCTVIGRLVTSSDGQKITSQPVYAVNDVLAVSQTGSNERQYITDLGLRTTDAGLTNQDEEAYTVPWSGKVYVNGDTARQTFSLLIIKLPSNGMTRTYSSTTATTNTETIVTESIASGAALRLCVLASEFGAPASTGVRVLPLAGNIAGVQRIASSDTGDAC